MEWGANEILVNVCFMIGSRLYMKNMSRSNKYVTATKPLKTVGFSD